MNPKTRIATGTLVAIAALFPISHSPVHAADDNHRVGDKDDLKVVQFEQFWGGGGYVYRVHRPSACTPSTTYPDYSKTHMDEKGWDNSASYIRDYHKCDTKIYRFENHQTALTGYVNYGETGKNVADGLNNLTSSFHLS